ncbi:MAG: HAMP domain-containing histidine kinase [Phyllobacteriaceae bacterium]|nr:HAMP domain-containing histidine kinase [Phyllobacteriaceae bacterium]
MVERIGEVYLDGLSATVEPNAAIGHERDLARALERVATYHDGVREVRIVVRAADGTILGDLARDDVAAAAPLPPLDTEIPLITTAADRNRFWVQRPLLHDGTVRAVLSAQLDLKPIRDERLAADIKSLTVNALMAAGVAAFGFWLIRRLLAPLRLLETALARAAAGDPQPIGAVEGVANPRLHALIRAYDVMATAQIERTQLRIAQAERLRAADLGRLAATVAHEVRNPLAGMLNAVDTARRFPDNREAVASSLDLLERGLGAIARVVDTTLSFHRTPRDGKPVDAVDFDDLARLVRPVAERRGVRLDWSAEVAGPLPLDAGVVRQIVLNLALNAIGAARPAGRVAVTVRAATTALELTFEDDGAGLDPAVARRLEALDLDWIDTSEGGIGLGVVMRAVAALGGRILTRREEKPPRTTIEVRLPGQASRDPDATVDEEAS